MLIHEAHTPAWLAKRSITFQEFSEKYHTTTHQLAELAKRAKPKLLILYHYTGLSYDEILNDMKAHYPGKFAVARDLDVY